MPFYILDYEVNSEGERHIHVDSNECYRLPPKSNQLAIGFYENCKEALDKADQLYNNVNACFNCCKECYSSPNV
jgi:hypothetical protein